MKSNLIIYKNKLSTFIQRDIEILDADSICIDTYNWIGFLKGIIRSFKCVFYEKTFIWFCDYHAFIPVFLRLFFRNKIHIIVGGYDAHNVQEIKYGIFYKNSLRKYIAVFCYRFCSKILCVTESLKTNLIRFGMPIEKIVVIPTGYDYEFFKYNGRFRENDFLTVAIVDNHQGFLRKGIDRFLAMAKKYPAHSFTIVGMNYRIEVPENVTVIPKVPENIVKTWMCASEYYCQFSRAEGLPNSLCEAMLCECKPLGSAVDGIPEAIGNTGIIFTKWDNYNFIESQLSGDQARKRIIMKFPIKKREFMLKNI